MRPHNHADEASLDSKGEGGARANGLSRAGSRRAGRRGGAEGRMQATGAQLMRAAGVRTAKRDKGGEEQPVPAGHVWRRLTKCFWFHGLNLCILASNLAEP
jgi:hypothetical protein